jgi:hypothetical protein
MTFNLIGNRSNGRLRRRRLRAEGDAVLQWIESANARSGKIAAPEKSRPLPAAREKV